MKFLVAILSLYATYSFANDTITCYAEENGNTYTLNPVSGNTFNLRVTGQSAYDPSCDSRWGCESSVVIFQQDMKFTGSYDRPQGTLDVYKGKRSKLEIQDNYGVYTYVMKNAFGTFVSKTVILECKI